MDVRTSATPLRIEDVAAILNQRVAQQAVTTACEQARPQRPGNAAHAGTGRITFAVAGLDALLERIAAQGIEHEPIETYSTASAT
ncbi:MAG: hypothetical protein ACR2LK_09550 [Solirubrobacteraceae bacterium]